MARKYGFTLLELILALAAVATVATVAIPAWFERGEITLQNAALRLAEDLEMAQGLALGAPDPVAFHLSPGGYRVVGADGELLTHPRSGQPFVRTYNRDAVFEGVELREINVAGGQPLIFDSRGFVSGGALIRLGFGDEDRLIRVEAPHGVIRVVGRAR